MKTQMIKTVFALAIIISGSYVTVNAATPDNTVSPRPEKTIANKFKFPTVLIPYNNETKTNESLKVEVIFTTDKDGKVTYAYAKTKDLNLKKEIEKQFSLFRLSQLKENIAHSVILNFKYIEG